MTSPATGGTRASFQAFGRRRRALRLAGVVAIAAGALLARMVPAGGAGADISNQTGPPWTELDRPPANDPSTLCPPAEPAHPRCRYEPAMAYDPDHNNVVLFGGNSFGSPLGDTWIWDGKTWTQANPQTSPPALGGAAMAYDGRHVVLFGGRTASSAVSGDTWIWDGSSRTWAQASPTLAPAARQFESIAYAGSRKVVLFGGTNNQTELGDTWVWDGQAGAWTQDQRSGPTPRKSASMTYDAAHGNVVLFGGSFNFGSAFDADTWTWTSATGWTKQLAPASTNGACQLNGSDPTTTLEGLEETAMAYDGVTGRVVMFGGQGVVGSTGDFQQGRGNQNTWIWDGTSWGLVDPCSPGNLPPPRHGAAMATNPGPSGGPRTVMLFGGIYAGAWNDTWIWSGAAPPPATTTTTTTSIVTTTTTTTAPAATTTTTAAPPVLARPIVRAVVPASGPVNGGTAVTITGTGFTGATDVAFGDVHLDCTRPNTCAGDDGHLSVTSPAHGAGTVDTVVTTAVGSSGIVRTPPGDDDEFTYFPPSPASNPTSFGSSASVYGPSQPGQPAPPGGFGSAPAPGGFSSAPVPGGFSAAPVPGAAAGASAAAPEVGGGLPPAVPSALAPGVAQPGAPVPGFAPPAATPASPASGVPPYPGPSPAPHFNMALAAPKGDDGPGGNALAVGGAMAVIVCCCGFARRRPTGAAPAGAHHGRPAPQFG